MTIPDVLASRYASTAMATIWSPEHKVVLERRLWLAVLRAQRDLGVDVPDGVVEAYEGVVDDVDLATRSRARERVTRHDVKARIEEFNALAGHEHVHKGMTSRDLTENVEQLQVLRSLELVRDRAVAVLARLAGRAARARRPGDGRALATTSPRRPRRSASGSRPPPTSCCVALRAARRADRPLPAARHQGPGRHGPGHARPARRRRANGWPSSRRGSPSTSASRGCSPASGRSTRARSTTTCVSALVQLAAGAVLARHDDPADGRARAGHRGLPGRARSARQRDAAQDEHPLAASASTGSR